MKEILIPVLSIILIPVGFILLTLSLEKRRLKKLLKNFNR
jgi:hypothetical protein